MWKSTNHNKQGLKQTLANVVNQAAHIEARAALHTQCEQRRGEMAHPYARDMHHALWGHNLVPAPRVVGHAPAPPLECRIHGRGLQTRALKRLGHCLWVVAVVKKTWGERHMV